MWTVGRSGAQLVERPRPPARPAAWVSPKARWPLRALAWTTSVAHQRQPLGAQTRRAAPRKTPCPRSRRAAGAGSGEGAGQAKTDDEDKYAWEKGGGVEQRPYQFGDLFINKLTGKDKYEFGDLSRWIGGKLQGAVGQVTGKETYEFGDISKFLDTKAKEEVCKLTGKSSYEFGDISKEIVRRIQAGEVDHEDMSLLLRAVLTLGLGLTPVAHLLPVQFLLGFYADVLKTEAEARGAGKLARAVAEELDRRAKSAILGEGNQDYVLGDWTKAMLQRKVAELTGKESYESGDITGALLQNVQNSSAAATSAPATNMTTRSPASL